jgi:hypothetical protein
MMIETDYYQLFRPTRESSFAASGDSRWMGLVDPLTFVLRLNEDIYSLIKSKKPFFRNWSTEQQIAAGVAIHETIHWWQLIGTTTGLFHASCINIQSNILTSLLKTWIHDYEPKKSAFLAFRDALARKAEPELHLLYNIVGRWMDLEFWSALMAQRSAAYRIADKPFFESSGKTLLRAAFYSLHQLLSLGGNDMHRSHWFNNWLDHVEQLSHEQHVNFSSIGILQDRKLTIGGNEIFEGQARLTEMQYLHSLTRGRLDFSALEKLNYLRGKYGKALQEFIRISGLPWPTNSLCPSVGLYLLACDLALNPPIPYPVEMANITDIVEHCHPGIRFLSICEKISQNPSKWFQSFRYTYEVHCEFTAALEPSPYSFSISEIAGQCVDFWMRLPDLNDIINGQIDKALELPSTPLKLLLRKHVLLMREKQKSPHLFCWYGALFIEVIFRKFGFVRYGPPLISIGQTGQIFGSPSLNEGKANNPENILYNLLISQGMNDLVRQWISKPGLFLYNYDWIDPREPEAFWRDALGNYLTKMYGIKPDDIYVLPEPSW